MFHRLTSQIIFLCLFFFFAVKSVIIQYFPGSQTLHTVCKSQGSFVARFELTFWSHIKTHEKLCQWIGISLYLCLKGEKNTNICHQRCGLRTILVRSPAGVALVVHNSQSRQGEVGWESTKLKKKYQGCVHYCYHHYCQYYPHCRQQQIVAASMWRLGLKYPPEKIATRSTTQLHRKIALSKGFWKVCVKENHKFQISQERTETFICTWKKLWDSFLWGFIVKSLCQTRNIKKRTRRKFTHTHCRSNKSCSWESKGDVPKIKTQHLLKKTGRKLFKRNTRAAITTTVTI